MFVIGIAGGSGSGKTTFARKVLERAGGRDKGIEVLSQDFYYLGNSKYPAHLRLPNNRLNNDHPDAFDWPLLRKHIETLKNGQGIAVPDYDYVHSERLAHSKPLNPPQVLLLEGIFALWDQELLERMDLKVFLQVEADIRLIRRLHRDIAERARTIDDVIQRYYETVRPMHLKYVEATVRAADLVVGEEHDRAADAVAAQIRSVLHGTGASP